MRKIALVKFQMNISGLYFWGKGWKDMETARRWHGMLVRLNTRTPDGPNIFSFVESALIPGDIGACESFRANGFYAYMHGMEVTGHYTSSEYCPTGADEAPGYVRKTLGQLATVIRETYPEIDVGITTTLKTYLVDLDEPDDQITYGM